MSSESHLVFVYGTLRRGASNAFRMEGAEFVRDAAVQGRLYRIAWYPGIVLDVCLHWVAGELWRVDERKFHELDEFEGVPVGETEGEEYRRLEVITHSIDPDREELQRAEELELAWVWEWKGQPNEKNRIRSGDWMDVEGPRPPKFYSCLCLPSLPLGAIGIGEFLGQWFGTSSSPLSLGIGLITI